MNTLEVIKKAKSLIDTPEKWVQKDYARTATGVSVLPYTPSACKFCSAGAIMKVVMTSEGLSAQEQANLYSSVHMVLAKVVKKVSLYSSILSFNDDHTHGEVMAVWDRAEDEYEDYLREQ